MILCFNYIILNVNVIHYFKLPPYSVPWNCSFEILELKYRSEIHDTIQIIITVSAVLLKPYYYLFSNNLQFNEIRMIKI